MNKKELAQLLNGRQYRNEINEAECRLAEESGLIVVFGASDDLLEFRGCIYDELGAWDGETVNISRKKLKAKNRNIHNVGKISKESIILAKKNKIYAVWCPVDEKDKVYTAWEILSNIPNKSFKIYEDDKLYCIGIVFHKDNLI